MSSPNLPGDRFIYPPIADIGRFGFMKLGSLIPWPGSFDLTVTPSALIMSARFSLSVNLPLRKIERKSVSVFENKQERT